MLLISTVCFHVYKKAGCALKFESFVLFLVVHIEISYVWFYISDKFKVTSLLNLILYDLLKTPVVETNEY